MTMHPLPSSSYVPTFDPGALKAFKSENRRSDALYLVAPDQITVDPSFNVRVATEAYNAHLRQIVDSIKADGFRIDRPISAYLRKGTGANDADALVVVDGHTRFAAVLQAIREGATIEHIPVIVMPKSTDATELTASLVVANTGRPLSPYETALVIKRLLNAGLTEADVVRRLNRSASSVNGLVALAAVPHKLAMLVAHERVAAATVIDMLPKHGAEATYEILAKALADAESKGKTKVTRSVLPGAPQQRAIARSAPRLFELAQQVKSDPAFEQLAEPTRAALAELLGEIDAAVPMAA